MFEHIKLFILDRDGVINADSDAYIKTPEEWHPIPGSLKAIAALNNADKLVAVATNQSGVGRGYYTLDTLTAIHDKMLNALKAEGGHLDALAYCPHTPDDGCDCRKPNPGMLQNLLSQFEGVNPDEVLMVGDALRDLEAAWALGCHAALVKTGKGERTLQNNSEALKDTKVFESLEQLVEQVI